MPEHYMVRHYMAAGLGMTYDVYHLCRLTRRTHEIIATYSYTELLHRRNIKSQGHLSLVIARLIQMLDKRRPYVVTHRWLATGRDMMIKHRITAMSPANAVELSKRHPPTAASNLGPADFIGAVEDRYV